MYPVCVCYPQRWQKFESWVSRECSSFVPLSHSFSLNARVALVRRAVHIFVAFQRERENPSTYNFGERTCLFFLPSDATWNSHVYLMEYKI